MSVEINGLPSTRSQGADPSQGSTAPEAPDGQAGQPGVAPGREADTVALTDAAQQLSRLEHALKTQPVVDTQRVQAVREALDQGVYQIDARGIASKLLQFEAYLPNG